MKRLIGAAAFIAVAAWLTFSQPSKRDDCTDPIAAFVMSQGFVQKALRSPSTAKFPYYSSEGVDVSQSGHCTFLVRAYVDAQNAFGGTQRTPYSLTIRPDGNNQWSASDLTFAR